MKETELARIRKDGAAPLVAGPWWTKEEAVARAGDGAISGGGGIISTRGEQQECDRGKGAILDQSKECRAMDATTQQSLLPVALLP